MAKQLVQSELQQPQAWQQAILDSADFTIISTDPQGIIQTLNAGALRKLGYQPEEVIGKVTPAIIHDPQEVAQRAQQLSQELGYPVEPGFETFVAKARLGIPDENNWTYIRKDQSRFPIWLSVTALRDGAGNLSGFLGIGKDISKQQKIEQSLHESEARFAGSFQHAAIGMAIVSLEGYWLQVNASLCDIIGYSEDELLTLTFQDITHPDDLEIDLAYLQQLLAGEIDHCHIEKRYIHKQGHEVWILLSASLVCGDDGQPLNIIVQIQDISQRKQAEAALQQFNTDLEQLVQKRTAQLENAYNKLKASEAKYQDLYDNAPDMYISVDAHTSKVQQCNQTLCHTLGFHEDEILNQLVFEIFHPDCHHHLEVTLQGLVQTGEVQDAQLQLRRKDGSKLEVSLYGQVIRDKYGNVLYSRSSLRDITERKRLERKLKQAIETADHANRAKGQFLANMSHELRTPLNVILGYSQFLGRNDNLTLKQINILNTINQSGSHLLDLINSVLEITKIDSGKVSVRLRDFNLHTLLKSLHNMFRLKAKAKGLQIEFDLAPDLPVIIQSDESRLRQVLINLLGNAIKFTDSGHVRLHVWIYEHKNHSVSGKAAAELPSLSSSAVQQQTAPQSNSHLSGVLTIEVDDTGPGISAQDIDSMFDLFTQSCAGHKASEGTGLGLAICHQFIQLLQGEISIDSQEGQGTLVKVQIPIKITEDLPLCLPSYQEVLALAPDQPSYRILVVEDHQDTQQMLVNLLETVGFTVRSAQGGQQAISLWQDWCPHLILMDWQMPGMNGYQTTQRIRQLESLDDPSCLQVVGEYPVTVDIPAIDPTISLSRTIIIALTASVFEDTQQESNKAGCDGFICKPFQENILFQAIAEHLEIKYTYRKLDLMDDSSNNLETPTLRSSEMLLEEMSHLSKDWLKSFEKTALELNEDFLQDMLSEISAMHPILVQELRQLLTNLRFDTILDLTQQAIDQTNNE